MRPYKNIDEFISNFPPDVQATLKQLRKTIKEVVPGAGEKIAYGIPTFTFHGNLVHFSAYSTHIGFYPGSGPIAEFKKDLTKYKTAKGTVQFPLDKPLPLPLIKKMVKSAATRNLGKKEK